MTFPDNKMPQVVISDYDETTGLLPTTGPGESHNAVSAQSNKNTAWRILPIAFVGGFGIAGTVPSILYVYRSILCDDRSHCLVHEKESVRSTVAAATILTNVLSIVMLGPVQRITHWRRPAGLSLWLIARALSVLCFALAATTRNVILAFVAQAFEGISVDNLLHFNLSAAYTATTSNDADIQRLFPLSLGLYMAGMAFGPAISSVLPDPRIAFYLAALLFVTSMAYLLSPLVQWPARKSTLCGEHRNPKEDQLKPTSLVGTLLAPLSFFYNHPATIFYGLTLLSFTCGQAFFFPSLLIWASTDFNLSEKQIAGLVTVIAAASSVNLFLLVTILPWLTKQFRRLFLTVPSTISLEASTHSLWTPISAIYSFTFFFLGSLFLLTSTHTLPQLFLFATLCSLGNAAPPFVKSHLTTRLAKDLQTSALAALALCETAGSLLSPIVVGGNWVRTLVGETSGEDTAPVFAGVTAMLMAVAAMVFSLAVVVGRTEKRDLRSDIDRVGDTQD